MLKLHNISIEAARYKWYGEKQWFSILNNISLEVAQGEIVALVGGSGEGKSLLLQSILNILPSNIRAHGDVYFEQDKLSIDALHGKYKKNFCYLPQGVQAFNPLLTIEQHFQRACVLSGNKFCKIKVKNLLEDNNLDFNVIDKYPLQLSGGMAKRVFSCYASLSQASFILADEITSWLDRDLAHQMMNNLRLLCKQGAAVLWVTHDLNLASEYADRMVFLYDGKVADNVNKEQLLNFDISDVFKKQWQAIPDKNAIWI